MTTPTESVLKELWGKLPEVYQGTDKRWTARMITVDFVIALIWHNSRAEAITAWNQLVDKIEGER